MLALAAFVLVSWWATHGLLWRWGCALCVLTRYVCHPNQGEPVAAGFIKPSLGCPHAETAPRTHTFTSTHTPSSRLHVWSSTCMGGRAHTNIPLAIRVYMGLLLLHFNEWRCSFSTLFSPLSLSPAG